MRRLLLADGSLTIQRVVELTFAGKDVQVTAVADGEQAVARIPLERPDIVLADVGTRKRSGYDVCAFVKGRPDLAHIPVLLLTGAFEPVDQGRADAAKCDGVIVKPFDPSEIVGRVRDLLDAPTMLPSSGEPDAAPAATRPVGQAGRSLDDYFDRLDAAFATLGAKPRAAILPAAVRDAHTEPEPGVPTVASVLDHRAADTLADDVARLVLERLSSDAAIADAVRRIAEQVVREQNGKSQRPTPDFRASS